MSRRVALVTGASRGIGKATALALAEAGFEVAITARTVKPGERFERSPTLAHSDTRPAPGSLEETAAAVTERGRRALALRMDLQDEASVLAAARDVEAWGPVELLVNNAVHTGPGNMDRFLDLPGDVIEQVFRANVFSQAALTRALLPRMLERGTGVIVNVTSAVATTDPPAPAGEGGWGFAYAASKAAFHRLTGILAVELRGRGVRVHNLEPGFVMTEMMERNAEEQGLAGRYRAAPPRVPAAVIAWLATSPDAAALHGQTVEAQPFCKRHSLLADWP